MTFLVLRGRILRQKVKAIKSKDKRPRLYFGGDLQTGSRFFQSGLKVGDLCVRWNSE